MRYLIIACLLAAFTAASPANELGKRVAAVATAEPPVIDGVLDDAAWRNAPLIMDFHLVEPVEFARPTDPTEVRVLYDRDNLYIAVHLVYTDPSQLVADIMVPRQRVWSDDRFAIVLDPFFDRRNGYYFELNANGVLADGLIENNNQLLEEWDGIWHAETRITDDGWTAEIVIPTSTLSFDPTRHDWGINFLRHMRVSREEMVWSSNGKQDFQSAPSLAGTLEGLEELEQGLGLDVIPSASLVDRRDYVTGEHETRLEPSLDVTYRLTPSLTGKLTLNTDFSATEVDDRRINLTRFSLFFPEKREFFLQDAGIFEFGGLQENGRPFFSRTIGLTEDGEPLNLEHGLKLTGRIGDWALGFLGVRQEASSKLGAQDLFVGRAAVNVLSESSVGVMVTDGDPRAERDARTLGFDLRYRTQLPGDRVLQGEAWYQRSDNEMLDPGAPTGNEGAWGIHARMPDDRHWLDAAWFRFGSGFDPAMGFVSRTGVDEKFVFYRFRHRPSEGYFVAHDFHAEYYRAEDLVNSDLTEQFQWTLWKMETHNSDEFRIYVEREREVMEEGFDLFERIPIAPGDYAYTRYGFRIETAWYRQWATDLHVEVGDFFDGTRTRIGMGPRWTPSPHFNLQLQLSSNDVKLSTGAYVARLAALRAEWALTNRLSFIPNVQFDNVSDELGIDIRLRWQPRRGQDFLLAWNRNMLRDVDDRFRRTDQETVLKGVYTLRF